MNTFYLTTPIYYVNAQPHLGHAYTTIVADVATRFHRLLGEEALLITGTDEHGDKIVQAARRQSKEPKDFADDISDLFRTLWPRLATAPDIFIRTTDKQHQRYVQAFLQKVYENGDIYFGEYGGHYCYGCERFYTEKELENGLCPQHMSKPEYLCEKNYFFRMSKYRDWLINYIHEHPQLIRPERYRNEALALLEQGELEDLCISRPKSRLTWGIELPFDNEFVCYVWFDALLSYLSALDSAGSEALARFWPHAQHLVAKDILKPHAIFWPTMLKAAGLPIFKHLNVHGYWLADGHKMSKSIGNVIVPLELVEKYGIDAFRYFLLREMHFGNDANFSESTLITRFNADLANDLGNLFSRVLAMAAQYCNSQVPNPGTPSTLEETLEETGKNCLSNFQTLFLQFRFSQGLEALWEYVRSLNKYIDDAAPWTLAKNGETKRLHGVLYVLLESMRKVALHLWPIMPEKAETMLTQLGLSISINDVRLEQELEHFSGLTAGTPLASQSSLFPRIDTSDRSKPLSPPKTSKRQKELQPKAPAQTPCCTSPENTFENFQTLNICIGTVRECARHPKADKLLQLSVDLGDGAPKQIISGIAEHFSPTDLIGLQVAVLANLPVRTIRGLKSEGMLLTVHTPGKKVSLLTSAEPVANGSKVE